MSPFRLRYPTEGDPFYRLMSPPTSWEFTSKSWALDAYNAALRAQSLMWQRDNPGAHGEQGKRKKSLDDAVGRAWVEFQRIALTPPAPRKQGRR